jgi:hypothetical protein
VSDELETSGPPSGADEMAADHQLERWLAWKGLLALLVVALIVAARYWWWV